MYEEKLSLLESVLGDAVIRTAGRQAYFFCPKCEHHKKKLNVNLETGQYKCWICDGDFQGRNIGTYLIKEDHEIGKQWFALAGEPIAQRNFETNRVSLPKEYKRVDDEIWSPVKMRAKKYLLEERSLKDREISKYNIGFCDSGYYNNYTIFPSYDTGGKINYFVARALYSDMSMRYRNPDSDKTAIVFNEMFIDWEFPVFIVEGIFDAIKVGDNAIPLLGSALNEDHILLEKLVLNRPPCIYLGFDADAEKKQRAVASLLMEHNLNVKMMKVGSKFEDLGKVVNREDIQVLVNESSDFDFEEQLRGLLNL